MNDGEETRRENQQSQGHADTALPTTPAPNPKQPHGEDIHGGANGEPQDSKKWFRNADWWMVIVTAAGFFVGFITLVVFYSQFKEMKTQTGILNDQATQAAKDSSESSRKVERQLKIAKQQADAADNNVKVIQWQFRQDQRAWVGPEQVVHSKLSEGKPSFGVILRNTGKTPALEFKDGIMVMPFKKGQQFKPFYYEGAHECATEREPHSVRVKIKSKWTGTSISSLFPQQIHT